MLDKIKQLYGLVGVDISILPYVGRDLNTETVKYQAILRKYFDKYVILVIDDSDMKNLLLHECAHIRQYEDGDLVDKDGISYWKGKDISLCEYKYRPHEKNARRKANKIKKIWRKESI